jgi:hypothetical protein
VPEGHLALSWFFLSGPVGPGGARGGPAKEERAGPAMAAKQSRGARRRRAAVRRATGARLGPPGAGEQAGSGRASRRKHSWGRAIAEKSGPEALKSTRAGADLQPIGFCCWGCSCGKFLLEAA